MFLILYIVFAKFLKIGDAVPHYPVYLLLGIVLWNYFTDITTGSIMSIFSRGDLIRKINFPKYVIVLSGCVAAFINLLLNFVVIAVFMVISDVKLGLEAFLFIPLLLELTALAVAFAFFLSAAFIRFRDISYIWEVLMQGAFYATPILYPLSLVPEAAQKLLILNPVAQIIQDARQVIVTPQTITLGDLYVNKLVWLLPIALVIVISVLSVMYFRKRSKYFAEEV
jgi:ABC-2 type transport system permease protein